MPGEEWVELVDAGAVAPGQVVDAVHLEGAQPAEVVEAGVAGAHGVRVEPGGQRGPSHQPGR